MNEGNRAGRTKGWPIQRSSGGVLVALLKKALCPGAHAAQSMMPARNGGGWAAGTPLAFALGNKKVFTMGSDILFSEERPVPDLQSHQGPQSEFLIPTALHVIREHSFDHVAIQI